MNAYTAWVTAHPFLSASLQFAMLGTAGEVLAASVRKRRAALPCTPLQLLAKVAAWARDPRTRFLAVLLLSCAALPWSLPTAPACCRCSASCSWSPACSNPGPT